MGKKKVKTVLRLAIEAGKASPGYPIGPALGQHSVNIMEFCRAYNEQTATQAGLVIPAEITIYEDRTFTFVTKTPPTADLIKRAAGIPKGSSKPPREQAGELTRAQALEIAQTKLPDVNSGDLEAIAKMVEGTARSMGVKVTA
ncbi:MAG TPA: 50S ribosomal protein L11 [Candidatus Dormibacteraeota bacterium]|nr:50S ribosomal protein L11 [Candidatus Dormibacteraeota bacterium]